MKLPFALWTRIAVQQLIKQLWAIQMPIRTVGEYLSRWGFTPQKPLKKAYKQNPKAVKAWLDGEYPDIAKRAKIENAEIHWGDETGLCNDSYHGRSYAPRGETPAIRLHPRCKRVNLISSVTNQGKVRFMVYNNKMNSQTMIKFMKRLIKDASKKIFLIVDNLRVHHSYIIKDWLKENKNEIELFFLPSYSPELNPDEYLNCDLKDGVHSGVMVFSFTPSFLMPLWPNIIGFFLCSTNLSINALLKIHPFSYNGIALKCSNILLTGCGFFRSHAAIVGNIPF